MVITALLDELIRAHGASGHEDAVQAIVRCEATAIGAEMENDVLDPTIATVRFLR
jgi:putative aminopeptidase FrvX